MGVLRYREMDIHYIWEDSHGDFIERDISFSKEKLIVLNEAGMNHNVNWREELWIGF